MLIKILLYAKSGNCLKKHGFMRYTLHKANVRKFHLLHWKYWFLKSVMPRCSENFRKVSEKTPFDETVVFWYVYTWILLCTQPKFDFLFNSCCRYLDFMFASKEEQSINKKSYFNKRCKRKTCLLTYWKIEFWCLFDQ